MTDEKPHPWPTEWGNKVVLHHVPITPEIREQAAHFFEERPDLWAKGAEAADAPYACLVTVFDRIREPGAWISSADICDKLGFKYISEAWEWNDAQRTVDEVIARLRGV